MNILDIPADHPAASITSPMAANRKGMESMQQGDNAAAAFYFARAAALDGQAGALFRNLANAYRNMGKDEAERAALDAALERDRTDFAAWLRKAELHERREETADAIASWNAVVQIADQMEQIPDSIAGYVAHGRTYLGELGRRISDEVERSMGDDLRQLDPANKRRIGAFIDHAAGVRRIFHNECAGLHYPFLPADEFFDDHHFPWFADLAKQTGVIRDELLALVANSDKAMQPYVRMDKGTPVNKWSELDHSLDWGAFFLWEYGVPNEAVLEQCPQTRAALEAVPRAILPGRAPSVFFSLLKPHTHIPPHTGVSNTRAIIHLPLIVPEGCGFRVGGETRQWVEGQPFAFDDTIEHEAWNNSDELRAILIFDVWNPHLSVVEQEMIGRFYEVIDLAGLNSKSLG